MNEEELRERFPNASTAFIRANTEGSGQTTFLADHPRRVAKLERHLGDGTLGKVPVQKRLGAKFLVRLTAIRNRLLDEDNLCEKYHVDLCRYAGILPGDGPGTTKIEVCQQKADPGAAEEVRIEVYELR